MRRRLQWWWRVAVVAAGIALVSLAASFVWVFGWTDAGGRYYVYLEHGMLCGNPNVQPPGMGPLSWYGHFEVYRSGVYTPWDIFPDFDFSTPGPSFRCPVHLPLLVLLAIVAYPLTPFAIRRARRKHGLCVKCGYDLTGNTSGVCPECGERI